MRAAPPFCVAVSGVWGELDTHTATVDRSFFVTPTYLLTIIHPTGAWGMFLERLNSEIEAAKHTIIMGMCLWGDGSHIGLVPYTSFVK